MNPQHDPSRPDRMAIERERIEFLVRRDGIAAAAEWVRRTARIYRQAVLNPQHHASRDEYRRRFIQSYCAFKAWLGHVAGSADPVHPAALHE